jgi:IS1 transposase
VDDVEVDEMWAFMGKKQDQRWLWHAIDHYTSKVLAYVVGRRKDEVFLQLTGCEFSAAQELLIVATEEGHSSRREWCAQKKAEDSGVPPGTTCRCSRGVFARALVLHCPGMAQLSSATSSSELALQNSQPVNQQLKSFTGCVRPPDPPCASPAG